MAKPQYRYRQTMSLARILAAGSNDHRRFSFFNELARSAEAARIIGPILKPFRLAIDFSQPNHCRLQGRHLTLTVRDSAQQNRLRQLTPRMKKALETHGFDIDDIEIRLVPVPFRLPELPPAPVVERAATLEGAFSVRRCAERVDDPDLKATLLKLEGVLTPKTNYREALDAQIERETERRTKQLEVVRARLADRKEVDHLRFLCPSAEDAARDARFAPVRARMLAKIHIAQQEETALRGLLSKLEERFRALLRSRVRLVQGEAPEVVATDLYAVEEPTEIDRLYADIVPASEEAT